MGKVFGYFFMVCAGLCLLALVSDLIWMRRTGFMFVPFGQELTLWFIGGYVGAFVSLMFSAWIAFVLQEIREGQQDILDRLAGRGTGPLTLKSEPRLQRSRAA
ncbi:hypothetical protein [Jannaschia pohangensis]|uniref:Uncharacterized protein n=1 Tax=Jannaschia pohangensis TaxID=390807 RepID=A0A1I3NR62_9RHOB|nr:hypothetical protein [Jannaschia pohangensis]SFJ11216.1 hypothetical protein SAMN04488095_2215 [Jannaschia pohangensis]